MSPSLQVEHVLLSPEPLGVCVAWAGRDAFPSRFEALELGLSARRR